MIVLQTRGLEKVYGTGEARVRALDGVDLDVEQGEFVAVVGTSGSGKSTLLHMLGGLDRPTAGTVTVDGRNIFALSDEALTVFRRRKIGFVFQAYNLVPVLSVWENIVLPVQLDGRRPDKAYLSQVVEALGLAEKLDRLDYQLAECSRRGIYTTLDLFTARTLEKGEIPEYPDRALSPTEFKVWRPFPPICSITSTRTPVWRGRRIRPSSRSV